MASKFKTSKSKKRAHSVSGSLLTSKQIKKASLSTSASAGEIEAIAVAPHAAHSFDNLTTPADSAYVDRKFDAIKVRVSPVRTGGGMLCDRYQLRGPFDWQSHSPFSMDSNAY